MARIIVILTILSASLSAQHVTIADSGAYYHVTCDLASAGSRYQMGWELGQAIAGQVPEFEGLVDSYLAERSGSNSTYNAWLFRMRDIWPQVPQEFREEIDGMIAGVVADTVNVRGDGKLSRDEIRLLNLFPDCARSSQCAGLVVFGPGSASGHPMTARLLDWHSGNQNQLGKIQAVTFIKNKNGTGSACLIGFLGFLGAVTGFNEDGLFAGILDSPSGIGYSSSGRRSYAMDIRKALEDFSTLDQAGQYLSDTAKHYAYNHLVLLSDANTGAVLENNFSGSGANMRRALRRDTSALNPGVAWGYGGSVAAVNSFVLLGNHDNHTGVQFNTGRWASFQGQVGAYGQVDWEDLKLIAGFDNGNGPGYEYTDIYNAGNLQVVCFRPDSQNLEAAFKPKSGVLPGDPIFQRVPLAFDSASGVNTRPGQATSAKPRLKVYPNPCRGRAWIFSEAMVPGEVRIDLYDVAGRQVKTLALSSRAEGKIIELDTKGLSRGVYVLSVSCGNTRLYDKLVKAD